MLHSFPWENGRIGIARNSQLGDLRAGEVLSAAAAAELIQSFRRKPDAMAALRKVLAEELNAQRVARMSDDDVVAQIRQGVTLERFLVVRERGDWRKATAGVAIVESPPPPSAAAPIQRTTSQPPPAAPQKKQCTNPACAAAFTDAAASGTPTVERGGPNC